jgi:hypothetical protein
MGTESAAGKGGSDGRCAAFVPGDIFGIRSADGGVSLGGLE